MAAYDLPDYEEFPGFPIFNDGLDNEMENSTSYSGLDFGLLDGMISDLASPLGNMGPDPLPDQVRHLLIAGYVIIIAAAALSNGLVMVVVCKSRKLHTVTNTFLMSLALSDFLIAVLNMPFQLHHYVSHVSHGGGSVVHNSFYLIIKILTNYTK